MEPRAETTADVFADAAGDVVMPMRRSRWERLWLGYPGWVLLNVAVLGVVLILDVLAAVIRGAPEGRVVCWLIAGGLVALAGLWLWMIGPARGAPDAVCRKLAQAAGLVSLVLAVLVSRRSPIGDVPGAIIALPPLIAVAFHHRPAYAMSLAVFVALLTLLPARLFLRATWATQFSAAFNAAGLALAGVVVAFVVSLLTRALRRETRRLRHSLAELRATRARLTAEEKLAAVGRLAAGIAHEIRNPVAMIASSLEMAAQDSTPPDTRAEMSDVARQEAARLTTLTNDFLAYARGKPPERQDVALDELTGYVADLVKARATETGAALKQVASPGLHADVDQFQLHQAMLNLATNALDATPAGGTITIGAAPSASRGLDGRRVDLFVENTGDAVPPDAVEKLFEPFFTTKPQGTGLGLPIARRIAEAHGGELLLTRNEPGRVRFTLRLPRGDTTKSSAESARERNGPT
jgi:signal transduction histidine kinase